MVCSVFIQSITQSINQSINQSIPSSLLLLKVHNPLEEPTIEIPHTESCTLPTPIQSSSSPTTNTIITLYLETETHPFSYPLSTKLGVVLYDMVKMYRDLSVTPATINKYCLVMSETASINRPLNVTESLDQLGMKDGQHLVGRLCLSIYLVN